jgi:hypothetical protein
MAYRGHLEFRGENNFDEQDSWANIIAMEWVLIVQNNMGAIAWLNIFLIKKN